MRAVACDWKMKAFWPFHYFPQGLVLQKKCIRWWQILGLLFFTTNFFLGEISEAFMVRCEQIHRYCNCWKLSCSGSLSMPTHSQTLASSWRSRCPSAPTSKRAQMLARASRSPKKWPRCSMVPSEASMEAWNDKEILLHLLPPKITA